MAQSGRLLPAMAGSKGIEDWGDGDFDFDGQDLRIDHFEPASPQLHAQTEEDADVEDWDKEFETEDQQARRTDPLGDFEQDVDDVDEENMATIKLSSVVGSTLKLMLEAQRSGQPLGTVTRLGTSSASAQNGEPEDWDEDLEIPDSLPLDADALRQRRSSFTSDFEAEGEPSASISTTTSTSYKSMLGLSTDFTDPESPPRKAPKKQMSGASSSASASASVTASSVSSFLLAPAYQFGGRGDAASLGREADSETDIEQDFEFEPGLEKLSLSPAVSRQRSHSTLDQEKLLWGEDASGRSASPEPTIGLSRSQSTSNHLAPGTDAAAPLNTESDADDEDEDPCDGLVLAGSIFEMDITNPEPRLPAKKLAQRLEDILNVRRSGESPETDSSSRRTDTRAESEADLAGGLVITDDLDLSPSRLSSHKLTYRTRSRGPSQMGPSSGSRTHPPRSSLQPASSAHHSAFAHPWPSREPTLRLSPAGGLSFPSRSEIFSPHQRQRTLSQLSISTSAGHGSEMSTRAGLSSARGRRPGGKGLQYKRSASDLQQKAAHPPSSQHTVRSKGLARKRSLPSLADQFQQQGRLTSSGAGAAGSTVAVSRPPSSFSSRLTASTAASRARAAETAADHLARIARDSPPPAGSPPSAMVASRSVPGIGRSGSYTRPSPADEASHRAKFLPPAKRGRVSSPLVQCPPPSAHYLRRTAAYGNGAELDSIEDLPGSASSLGRTRPERPARTGSGDSTSRGSRFRTKQQGRLGLIKPLGVSTATQKVVKGMRWNPRALRWEGNESALREFDSVVQSSTRPALISQLTGSSTSSAFANLNGYSSPVSQESSSLMANIACGVKMVGDMIFDPVQMKWVNRNCEEDEEVSAQFDEEGFSSEAGSSKQLDINAPIARSSGSDCGSEAQSVMAKDSTSWDRDTTIRARKEKVGLPSSRLEERWSPSSSGSKLPHSLGPRGAKQISRVEAAVVHAIRTHTVPQLDNVDEDFWKACVEAEARHRTEMQSFFSRGPAAQNTGASGAWWRAPTMEEVDRPRPHLYQLQKLARGLSKSHG